TLAGAMGFLREADHRDLYLKFLAGLGITEADARDHLPLPSTIGAASAIGYFCRSSFEEGLGAFGLGVELQVPGRPNGAEVIVKALRHYPLPRDAMEFYFVHVQPEGEHGRHADPLPATIGAASAIGYFCRSSFEEGLGAFGLGVELQVPGRPNGAEVIVKALRHYAIPRDAMEFYFVHVEAEEEHGGNAEAALAPF